MNKYFTVYLPHSVCLQSISWFILLVWQLRFHSVFCPSEFNHFLFRKTHLCNDDQGVAASSCIKDFCSALRCCFAGSMCLCWFGLGALRNVRLLLFPCLDTKERQLPWWKCPMCSVIFHCFLTGQVVFISPSLFLF